MRRVQWGQPPSEQQGASRKSHFIPALNLIPNGNINLLLSDAVNEAGKEERGAKITPRLPVLDRPLSTGLLINAAERRPFGNRRATEVNRADARRPSSVGRGEANQGKVLTQV